MASFVRRERASQYVLLVVVSFVITELVIRLILGLTGYPRLEFGDFHIAHALYGGLFLIIAAMLVLVYSSPLVLRISAVLCGVGLGFFVDEVGKFITKTNDYWHPAAVPLIYFSFLLIFFVHIYLNKPRRETQQEMLYDVIEDLKDILDYGLEPVEKEIVEEKLKRISSESKKPELRDFAKASLNYISRIDYHKEVRKNFAVMWFSGLREKLKGLRNIHAFLLMVLLFMLCWTAINSMSDSIVLGVAFFQSPAGIDPVVHRFFVENFPNVMPSSFDEIMLFVLSFIQFIIGVIILLGCGMVILKRWRGLGLMRFALVFSLCTSDIILLYYMQFSHFIPVALKLATIGYMGFYEQLYVRQIKGVKAKKPSGVMKR